MTNLDMLIFGTIDAKYISYRTAGEGRLYSVEFSEEVINQFKNSEYFMEGPYIIKLKAITNISYDGISAWVTTDGVETWIKPQIAVNLIKTYYEWKNSIRVEFNEGRYTLFFEGFSVTTMNTLEEIKQSLDSILMDQLSSDVSIGQARALKERMLEVLSNDKS